MERVAIRFNNNLYVHVTYDEGKIELYTVDKENNKTEYNVSKKTKRSGNTEDK